MDPRSYGGNSPMNNGSGVDNSGLLGNGSPNGMNNPNEMPKGAGNHGNQGGPPQQQNPHHQGPHPGQGGGGSNAVNIADYFNQLVRDKKNLSYLPNYFLHCERLLDEGLQTLFFNIFKKNLIFSIFRFIFDWYLNWNIFFFFASHDWMSEVTQNSENRKQLFKPTDSTRLIQYYKRFCVFDNFFSSS